MKIRLKHVWIVAAILSCIEIGIWLYIGGERPQLGIIGAFALACTGTAILTDTKDPTA